VIAGIHVEVHGRLKLLGELRCGAFFWVEWVEDVGDGGTKGAGKGHYGVEHRRLHHGLLLGLGLFQIG